MQGKANNLIGQPLEATDGKIGKVQDLYFDDQNWTLRYLVLATGTWLSGRDVLISTQALSNPTRNAEIIAADLTCEQVSNSPTPESDRTVSRQHEERKINEYNWEPAWDGVFLPGHVWGPIPTAPDTKPELTGKSEPKKNISIDPHLRSCRKVTGYKLHAVDGDIGHVADFIIDDQTWQISYLVVHTHHWIAGKNILVAVKHINKVNWEDSKVGVDLSLDDVKHCATLDNLL